MPRSYGDKFLIELAQTKKETIGIDLARLCVKANIPAVYVASAMGVTKLAVYAWFRGGVIREKRLPQLQSFIAKIKADLESGALPLPTLKRTKEYVQKLVQI